MSKQQPLLLLLLLLTAIESARYSSKYKEADYTTSTTQRTTNETKGESVEDLWPVKVFNCVGTTGVQKCLKIFLMNRIDRVSSVLTGGNDVTVDFDVVDEIKNDFPWESYSDMSENDIDSRMLRSIKSVFEGKRTRLVLHPGIDVDVVPDKNGTLMLNIKKDPELELPRGMKFPKKAFYRIVPMLLIPPLIMSAVLPFVLPTMKMMILGVGMLNQMALVGAVFTLMRNNAFQDTYEKKVIYVNSGYKNEKKPPPSVHHEHKFHGPPQFPQVSNGGFEEFGGEEEFHEESNFAHNSHSQFGQFDGDSFDRSGMHLTNNFKRGAHRNKDFKYKG